MVLMSPEISNPVRHACKLLIDVEREHDVCVLRCKGRFVSGVDPEYLEKKTEEIKGLNCGKVLLDFREVPQLGSCGLSFIVGIYTSIVRNPDGRFVLVGAQPRVREVLELTRLNTVIRVAADVAEGMQALR